MLAIAIGTVGGFVFNWLKMPLAWMLGSCVFSTVAAFAGLRIGMRVRLRQGMIIIMGVLLGSGFTPDLVQQLGKWALSLGVLTRHDHDRRDAGLFLVPPLHQLGQGRPATSPPCRAG